MNLVSHCFQNNWSLYKKMKALCVSFLVLIPSIAFSTSYFSEGITYQGRILTSTGTPYEAASTTFNIQILSPGTEGCILYEETQTISLAGSNGYFSFTIGKGTRSQNDPNLKFSTLFQNSAVMSGLTCSTGSAYTPQMSDRRNIRVQFLDSANDWISFNSDYSINPVPQAQVAEMLQDKGPSDFIQVNIASNVTQSSVETVFANFSELQALLNGTSALYSRANYVGSQSVSTTAPTSGQVLAFNSTTNKWEPTNPSVASVNASLGSVATPSMTFSGDLDTGIWSPGTNSMALSTGGSERLRVDSSGNVGIGTTVPSFRLHVVNSGGTPAIVAERNDTTGFGGTALALRATRGDTSTPVANFGPDLEFHSETFTNNDNAVVGTIKAAWEIDQTNNTTDRDSYLSFSTMMNDTRAEQLRITSSGNVGIGTTNPGYSLEVNGSINASNGYPFRTNGWSSMERTGTSLEFNATSQASSELLFYTNGDYTTPKVKFSASGYVGIGNTAPAKLLHVGSTSVTTGTAVANFQNVDGTCTITPAASGSGIACSSDERLKENFEDVQGEFALNRILKLQAVTYNFKTSTPENRRTGYKAQEVQKIAPEFVRENDDGYLQVYYDAFIPWITESIKTLYNSIRGVEIQIAAQNQQIASKADQAEMEALKAENAQLKENDKTKVQKLKELERRLEKIEKVLGSK